MTGSMPTRRGAKRAQIAVAARKLFLANGFAGTSMDAVTAEAKVSKQTLYTYFPTKIDLLSEIIAGELAKLELTDDRQPKLESIDDLRGVLLGFALGFTHTLLRPDSLALVRLVLGEVFRIPELRDSFRVALPGRVLSRTQELVRLADERKIIEAPNPELTARMFVGPLMTFIALDGFLKGGEVVPPGRSELEFIVDAFLTTVRRPS